MIACNAPRSRRHAAATTSCAAIAAPRSRRARRSRSDSGLSCWAQNPPHAWRPLHFPLLRVPVLLEIADQRRREMAIGLLARVDGHVAAELIERLLGDTKGAPVPRRAHDAGVREARNDPRERRIHVA